MAAVGQVIDDKYEILKLIGKGGMSKVYLAMDKRLNKQWAVKEIQKNTRDRNNEVVIQSAIAEANLIKSLDHPAIVRIVDIIENDEKIYIIEDYIEGETLSTILDEHGAQPQKVVIKWAIQLCEALEYLHNRIDLGRASASTSELCGYAAELRSVKGKVSRYRSELQGNWEGKEVNSYTGTMSSIESRLNSAANELEAIGRDISVVANEIWQEEEEERRRQEEEERRRQEEEERRRQEEEERRRQEEEARERREEEQCAASASIAAAAVNVIRSGGLKWKR